MHAQYGCGRSNVWQLPWLFLYILNASASVIDISLCMTSSKTEKPSSDVVDDSDSRFHHVLGSLLNFALSHGVLILASVVHHIPTAQPHKTLLLYMRAVLLIYTLNNW